MLLSISSTLVALKRVDESVSTEASISEQTLDAAWYPFDSGLFVTCSTDRIQLWDSQRLKAVRAIKLAGRCNQIAFSNFPSAASTLAVATNHGEVRLVDIASGSSAQTLMSGIDADIHALCWSPRDSHILATGGTDSRVLIWDVRKLNGYLFALDEHSTQHSARSEWVERQQQRNVQNYQVRTSLGHSRAPVSSVTFLENGRLLLSTASDGSVRLWQEGMLVHKYYNTHVSFSRRVSGQWGTLGFHLCHSKQTNIMFASNAVSDNLIDCVDMKNGKVVHSLSAHVRKVRCMAYREEGDPELYSAGDDGFVLKWCAKNLTDGDHESFDEDYWSS